MSKLAKPLPEWRETSEGWVCDEPESMNLAIIALVEGFSLPHFDTWLADLPDGEKKAAWLEWREETMACRNAEALTFRFKYAAQAQRALQWDQYVRPLAVTGYKQRQHPKRLRESNEPERARIRKRAKELWRENPGYSVNKVRDLIDAEGSSLGRTSIYDTIKPLKP